MVSRLPLNFFNCPSEIVGLHIGNRSSQKLPKGEERINVDLDAEAGKTGAPGRQSLYYCVIRQTKTLHMEYLGAYLQRKVSWDSTVLECMSTFIC